MSEYGLRESDGFEQAPEAHNCKCVTEDKQKQRGDVGGQPTRTLFKVEDIVVCIHLSGHK